MRMWAGRTSETPFSRAVPSLMYGVALHVFSETALLTLAHKRRVYLEWSRRAWGFDCSDDRSVYHDGGHPLI